MKSTTILFLKFHFVNAFVTGLVFALFMSLFDLATGDGFIFWKFIGHLTLFGILCSIFSIRIQKENLKKLGVTTFDSQTLSAKQQKIVESNFTPEEIYSILAQQRFVKNINLSDNGNISIRTKLSSISWGEKVHINILKSENRLGQYELKSRPLIPIVVYDGGRNYQNIIMLEQLISQGV